MNRFQNILVSIDASEEQQPVLDHAARFAEANGTSLTIVDVIPEFTWPQRLLLAGTEHLRDLLVREKQDQLKALIAPIRQRGVEIKARVLVGRGSVEIARQVVRGGHDLVMRVAKGTRSQRAGFFGTTSLELLRKCPAAVWLFRSGNIKFERVLAAVNATPDDERHTALSTRILETAHQLCASENAQLQVVQAWSIYGESFVRNYTKTHEFEDLENRIRDESRKGLDQLLRRFDLDINSEEVHLVRGEPSQIISKLVEEQGIDLLVMGSIARRGLEGLLMGNTADLILSQVSCSVLALKPDDFISPVKSRAAKSSASSLKLANQDG